MLTDILLGATLAAILITASLLYAALNDIQIALRRIELVQYVIADELELDTFDSLSAGLELQDEAQTVAPTRQSTRV